MSLIVCHLRCSVCRAPCSGPPATPVIRTKVVPNGNPCQIVSIMAGQARITPPQARQKCYFGRNAARAEAGAVPGTGTRGARPAARRKFRNRRVFRIPFAAEKRTDAAPLYTNCPRTEIPSGTVPHSVCSGESGRSADRLKPLYTNRRRTEIPSGTVPHSVCSGESGRGAGRPERVCEKRSLS